MIKKKILFVCTGNVFRSFSAELLLKRYLEDAGIDDVEVSSAGTRTTEARGVDPDVIQIVKQFGVSVPAHSPRQVTKEILLENDLVIAMTTSHLEELENNFAFSEAVLFNDVLKGEKTSINDEQERLGDNASREAIVDLLQSTISYLHENIPLLNSQINDRYLVFSDFVTGRRKENRGLTVDILLESEHAAAFMSAAIPEHEDAHILVIPKKRYMHMHSVPTEVLNDVFAMIRRVANTLNAHYDGYNLILNNGTEAGQAIFHTHFHLIPRKKGDGIEIQQWKKQENLTREEFKKMNERFKSLIAEA